MHWQTPHEQPGMTKCARAHGHKDTTAELFRTTKLEDFSALKHPSNRTPSPTTPGNTGLDQFFVSLATVPRRGQKVDCNISLFPLCVALAVR